MTLVTLSNSPLILKMGQDTETKWMSKYEWFTQYWTKHMNVFATSTGGVNVCMGLSLTVCAYVCVCVCVFHNFELLRCYVCTIHFLGVL